MEREHVNIAEESGVWSYEKYPDGVKVFSSKRTAPITTFKYHFNDDNSVKNAEECEQLAKFIVDAVNEKIQALQNLKNSLYVKS